MGRWRRAVKNRIYGHHFHSVQDKFYTWVSTNGRDIQFRGINYLSDFTTCRLTSQLMFLATAVHLDSEIAFGQ
jgi:hypothetical protein